MVTIQLNSAVNAFISFVSRLGKKKKQTYNPTLFVTVGISTMDKKEIVFNVQIENTIVATVKESNSLLPLLIVDKWLVYAFSQIKSSCVLKAS